jgi:hypothetical protein
LIVIHFLDQYQFSFDEGFDLITEEKELKINYEMASELAHLFMLEKIENNDLDKVNNMAYLANKEKIT